MPCSPVPDKFAASLGDAVPSDATKNVDPAVSAHPKTKAAAVLPVYLAGAPGLDASIAAQPAPTVNTEQTAAVLSTALIVSGGSPRLTSEASTSVAQITINAETQQHQDDAEPHNATNPDAEAPEESVNVTTPFQVSSAAHPTSHGSTEQTVAQPTAAAARQPQGSGDLDNIAHSDPVVLEASKPAKASVQASAAAGLTPKCSIAEPASQPVAANSATNAGSSALWQH